MEERINRCALCKSIVSIESSCERKKIQSIGGISIGNLKTSIGGWGHSKRLLDEFSGEVCNECYLNLSVKMEDLAETFNQLKDSRANETISIEKINEKTTTIHRISNKPWWMKIFTFTK